MSLDGATMPLMAEAQLVVGRGDSRVGDVLVVKVYCVTEAITVCGLNMAAMCAVVFGGSTDVPPIYGVEGPCPA